MTTAERNIQLPIAQIQAFCQRYPIEKLSLFGSVLRDDFRGNSDIDFLVEFPPDAPVTYFLMAEMEFELENIIRRRADLRTSKELNPKFRQRVIDTAEPLYVRQ